MEKQIKSGGDWMFCSIHVSQGPSLGCLIEWDITLWLHKILTAAAQKDKDSSGAHDRSSPSVQWQGRERGKKSAERQRGETSAMRKSCQSSLAQLLTSSYTHTHTHGEVLRKLFPGVILPLLLVSCLSYERAPHRNRRVVTWNNSQVVWFWYGEEANLTLGPLGYWSTSNLWLCTQNPLRGFSMPTTTTTIRQPDNMTHPTLFPSFWVISTHYCCHSLCTVQHAAMRWQQMQRVATALFSHTVRGRSKNNSGTALVASSSLCRPASHSPYGWWSYK